MTLVELIEKFDELVTPELWTQCIQESEAREDKIAQELQENAKQADRKIKPSS